MIDMALDLSGIEEERPEESVGGSAVGYYYSLIALSAILLSVEGTLQAVLIDGYSVPPATFILYDCLFIYLFCLLYLFANKEDALQLGQLSRHEKILLLKLGIFNGLAVVPFSYAYKYLNGGSVVALSHACPVFVYLMSYFFFKNPMAANDIIAILLSLSGVLCIVQPSSAASSDRVIGSCLALASAFFASLAMLVVKEAMQSVNFALQILAMGWPIAPTAILLGGLRDPTCVLQNRMSLILIVWAAFLAFLASALTAIGLKSCRADRGSLFRVLEIPFGYLFNWLIMHYKPHVGEIIGGTLVILGTITLTASEEAHQEGHSPIQPS